MINKSEKEFAINKYLSMDTEEKEQRREEKESKKDGTVRKFKMVDMKKTG